MAADFNTDGQADVCCELGCSTLGCVTDGGITLLLSNGSGSYSAVIQFTVAVPINVVVTADFNNDNAADVAGISSDSGFVYIFLGTGTGSISSITNFTVPAGPRALVTADFNNDGNMDLATANYNANNVSVFLGNGAGGFSTPTLYSIVNNPSILVAGDFNNNGTVDLFVVASGTSKILKGIGNGTFTLSSSFNLTTGDVATADLNNDNILDLVSVNLGTVSVRFGTGNYQFGAPVNYFINPVPFYTIPIRTGDFNNDGRTDLATIASNSCITVFTGNSNGVFSSPVNFIATSGFTGLANFIPIDANSDGKLDFVLSQDNTPYLGFLSNCNNANVGFEDLNTSDHLKIYPNPANAELTIQVNNDVFQSDIATYRIYNGLGQLIRDENLIAPSGKAKINTEDLPNGLYLLYLNNKGSDNISKQFIVSR